jgi:hypothetical protein
MVFLREMGLSQSESFFLEQLMRSYKKNQSKFDEALKYLTKEMKDELLREDSEINRHLDEIIDRAKRELLLRRKIVVPNPSYQDIDVITDKIRINIQSM